MKNPGSGTIAKIQKEQEHGFSNPWLREERTDRNVRFPCVVESQFLWTVPNGANFRLPDLGGKRNGTFFVQTSS